MLEVGKGEAFKGGVPRGVGGMPPGFIGEPNGGRVGFGRGVGGIEGGIDGGNPPNDVLLNMFMGPGSDDELQSEFELKFGELNEFEIVETGGGGCCRFVMFCVAGFKFGFIGCIGMFGLNELLLLLLFPGPKMLEVKRGEFVDGGFGQILLCCCCCCCQGW